MPVPPIHLNRIVIPVVFLVLITSASAGAQTVDPQLVELRRQLAVSYLEPGPHMALAKYYLQKGERLQAFYLLEYARRRRFREEEFDAAFQKAFGKRNQVDSQQAVDTFDKGVELQRAGDLKQAAEYFAKAAELSPHSVKMQSFVGRYFFKERRDDLRALEFYLNAYFLDPHAYETEFVESRIRFINYGEAKLRYGLLARKDTPLEEILKERNPTVVVVALERVSQEWNPANLKSLLQAMTHDDEDVRWLATDAIRKNVDRSFDDTLKALLRDTDLRVRGLAAYIAVHRWKEQSFDTLKDMLREDAQLLRFDAVSALAMEGGVEGKRILRVRRPYENHPELRRLIDKALRP